MPWYTVDTIQIMSGFSALCFILSGQQGRTLVCFWGFKHKLHIWTATLPPTCSGFSSHLFGGRDM